MMARAGVNDFLLLIFGVRQDWQIAGMSTVGNHNDLSRTPCQLWSSAFLTHFVTKSYIFPFLVLASPSNWPFWGVSPRPLPTGYTITKARALGGGDEDSSQLAQIRFFNPSRPGAFQSVPRQKDAVTCPIKSQFLGSCWIGPISLRPTVHKTRQQGYD